MQKNLQKTMQSRPLLIVMTPVRNEAWVLRAFLQATSLWADYIIIADQMSTDGSRDIYPQYEKVILVDNRQAEMHQAATRRLLFEAAQKIEGDKILFALDADEFLSGDFTHTPAWNAILTSQPSECFCWRWMNLCPDSTKYSTFQPYYWAVHVDKDLWNGVFPDNFIHEWRLPWPENCVQTTNIEDFCSLHFAHVNVARQNNKERFYQVSSLATANSHWNFFTIYRMYHREPPLQLFDVPADAYKFYTDNGVDILKLIDLDDVGQYYVDVVKSYFARDGLKKYAWLDIWDEEWCRQHAFDNPQRWYHKAVLGYLKWSGEHRNLFTKAIDKLLKWQNSLR